MELHYDTITTQEKRGPRSHDASGDDVEVTQNGCFTLHFFLPSSGIEVKHTMEENYIFSSLCCVFRSSLTHRAACFIIPRGPKKDTAKKRMEKNLRRGFYYIQEKRDG